MKREDIEKAARYLGELTTPEMRHSETVHAIIQQVNAAEAQRLRIRYDNLQMVLEARRSELAMERAKIEKGSAGKMQAAAKPLCKKGAVQWKAKSLNPGR